MNTGTESAVLLPEAIGSYVAAYRKEHRITRDHLAQAGNALGAKWGRTSIENIEHGRFSPTIQTLYVLCRALSSLTTGGSVGLLDLVPSEGTVELFEGFAVPASRLREFLGDYDTPKLIGDSFNEFVRSLSGPPPVASLAETRVAKKLGIAVSTLREIAFELWGDPLELVVSQSVGSDASPQARGHETRRRTDELRSYLEIRDG